MSRVTYSGDEVKQMITMGKKLVLAADEELLRDMPEGHWIGGTIPYFMTEKGGCMSREKVYVTEIPSYGGKTVIRTFNERSINDIYKDAPENGFSIIIVPAASSLHLSFAMEAPQYRNFAVSPLIGWVSGVFLDDIGKIKPKVFFGEKGKMLEDQAVVMQVSLPDNMYADIDIVNIFEQGEGDIITFPGTGFSTTVAMINGRETNFAQYLTEKGIDTRLPLVANYAGAMVNISFQKINTAEGVVDFYAPVFAGIEYRHAKPVADYVNAFISKMPEDSGNILFSCNCILNYLYSELEGKKTGGITGPITFGEIAYQLLNQTLVYLSIHQQQA